MDFSLPEPPETLRGPARAFYDELRQMLALLKPTQLDAAKTRVQFAGDDLEVELAHADHDDWAIWVTVGERGAIVASGSMDEHFDPPSRGALEERPWTTYVVDFVAEIMRGEIEIETTFRGKTPAFVRHYNQDENGERVLIEHTGFLLPGRFFLWRPRRTETVVVSFL